MTDWRLKAARDTVVAVLPFQQQLRRAMWLVRRPHITKYHLDVIRGGTEHVDFLQKNGLKIEGASVLEIGSGWFPVIPLVFHAAGAKHVYLTDAYPLLDRVALAEAVDFVRDNAESVAKALKISPDLVRARLPSLDGLSFDQGLEALGFSYHAPYDFKTDMPDGVDAIYSHTVLEHIPREGLKQLLIESTSLLRPGGLACHGVDHSDHREHSDHNISRIDFLRYSEPVWKLLCLHPQNFTNRMRPTEYMAMFKDAGLDVASEVTIHDRKELDRLGVNNLADKFKHMDPDDLSGLWSWFILRGPPAVKP